MAFAALNGLRGLFKVSCPFAHPPIVILVLKLDPTNLVDFLVNKLLMASGAIFGLLVHDFRKTVNVLFGVRTNEEIAYIPPAGLVGRVIFKFPKVARRCLNRIMGVSFDVSFSHRVTGQARNSLAIAVKRSELRLVTGDILCPGKERNGVVTAAAIAGRSRTVLFGHRKLDGLKSLVHGRIPVSRRLPLLPNLFVTATRPATL